MVKYNYNKEKIMGYAYAMGTCSICKNTFAFNPLKVPSIRINGTREPVCQNCINAANLIRIKNGLDPIVPLPGAYDACDEGEL